MPDSARAARSLQDTIIVRMSGADRLRLACEMSVLARDLAFAGIRQGHPDWDTSRVVEEYLCRMLRRATDRVPVE